ncbi:glutathione S-transferase family protein [Sinorhizobium sp. BG8]|uniref:glutathione S-transferase family protein n=1 Tax=Sinorhizobium sp. BG8 TaxID=2613773 RepID=UPI00193E8903|nr:glutathione S-transferase family protein [Sinorhizobium sp. BG8]QRM53722.1 glutathione S-transferase family protein [Sinorhizobium sp. BG8]
MKPALYAHPFSSYCQKALIALYENNVDFEFRMLSAENPSILSEFEALWPLKRFPILVDGDRTVLEASIIIEYLGLHYPGPVRLIPTDPDLALQTRMLDRFFDNYIQGSQQKIVFDSLRNEKDRDAYGVEEARSMLDRCYAWLDSHMEGRSWVAGETFSLADCSAAPALFYADWTKPIDPRFANVHAYRRRLLERPSFARAVDEARPYRAYFPLGAPDRD